MASEWRTSDQSSGDRGSLGELWQRAASGLRSLGLMGADRPGTVAIYASSSGVALARGEFTEDDGFRVEMRSDPIEHLTQLREILAIQLKSLDLSSRDRSGCNLVLAPELYTMSMIDRPDVVDEDLRDAARWALQEQLDYPVEDAALDVFELPRGASRERPMLFVASMQTDFLRSLVREIHGVGLNVECVDIADLAVRNLSWRCFPQHDLGVGLLRLTSTSGLLNVSRGDELYLSRRISGVPAVFTEDGWRDFRDRLLLQVQRSIDYYESAMNQPPCNILLVSCSDGWSDRLTDYLGEMVAMPVRKISDVLAAAVELTLFNPERQTVDWEALGEGQVDAIAAGLPALGGALRAGIAASAQVEAA